MSSRKPYWAEAKPYEGDYHIDLHYPGTCMKCQNCSREIKIWQSACPYCQSRTPPKSFSTISEAPETSAQNSRRRLLQYVLQFSLVAITFIALASLVRFNPPKANPLPAENLRATTTTVPAPVSTPESSTPVAAPLVPLSAPLPEQKLDLLAGTQSLSLFSAEDLRLARQGTASAASPRSTTSDLPATSDPRTIKPFKSSSTVSLTDTVADEAAPKKITTLIATAGYTPPKSVPASAAEPDAKLEIEAAGVLLPANTGLVTIKSYVPARVYIDGVYSGATPRSVKLLAGEHTINLLADGYHEYSRKVKISGQQQLGILASMSKK